MEKKLRKLSLSPELSSTTSPHMSLFHLIQFLIEHGIYKKSMYTRYLGQNTSRCRHEAYSKAIIRYWRRCLCKKEYWFSINAKTLRKICYHFNCFVCNGLRRASYKSSNYAKYTYTLQRVQ